jgi:hypothetical protein
MSGPATLYGVQDYRNNNGELTALEWAEMRCPEGQSGQMEGTKRNVMWFADPGARDEFQGIFGGINVTLHRKPDAQAQMAAAINATFAKKFGG